MPIAVTDEQVALAASIRKRAKRAATIDAVAKTALELAGTAGAADDGDAAALLPEFLVTRCLSIAGGTAQILLSIVAERLPGPPREEAR